MACRPAVVEPPWWAEYAPQHYACHAQAAQEVVEEGALGWVTIEDDDVVFGACEGLQHIVLSSFHANA